MKIADKVLAAQDVARAAILEHASSQHVGEFLEVSLADVDDPKCAIALHTFASTSPAYPGWYWAVAVVAIEDQEQCTISEVNLLPGPTALVPDAWTPWAQRIQPGDLGVGDLLPAQPGDERLTAGFTGADELAEDLQPLHPAQWELGLGREQVLSSIGMEQAVSRWFAGDTGPRAAMAKAAPASCGSCGFFAAIGGSLGQVFGICANEFGAADGHIVATTFGCGAHSSVKEQSRPPVPVVGLVVDDQADETSSAKDVPDYVIPEEPDSTVDSSESTDISVGSAFDIAGELEATFVDEPILDDAEVGELSLTDSLTDSLSNNPDVDSSAPDSETFQSELNIETVID